MEKLIILRHTQSTGDRDKTLGGQRNDIVLTEQGVKQAQEIAKLLSIFPINSIYSSTLKRAYQVAQLIGSHSNLSINLKPCLMERSWGNLEGRLDEEIKTEMDNRFTYKPLNGESFMDFEKRVLDCINGIIKNEAGTILVVTHGGVKEVLARKWAPDPLTPEFTKYEHLIAIYTNLALSQH